jgi:hypothetical protein
METIQYKFQNQSTNSQCEGGSKKNPGRSQMGKHEHRSQTNPDQKNSREEKHLQILNSLHGIYLTGARPEPLRHLSCESLARFGLLASNF